MRYAGVAPVRGLLQLVLLEEVRESDPPIRLRAVFYEPGAAAEVENELRALGEFVLALAAPLAPPAATRACDEALERRGVRPQPFDAEAGRLAAMLSDLRAFESPDSSGEGAVPDGSYREAPVFETNADGVFCALRGGRLPAKRHPHGIRLRIEELEHDHVLDDGGGLWARRIEEVDAAGAALCAHRYAVGHASWLGAAGEGTVVLPGSTLPHVFDPRGVLPPVERLKLPPAG